MKQFLQTIAVVTALAYGLIYFAFQLVWPLLFHWTLLLVPIFIASVTYTLHHYLVKASGANPQKFISQFMAVTGVKLLVYLFTILIYVFAFTTYAIPFLAIFFTLYIAFTIIEVVVLLKHVKTLT
ncbi:MAG: hypothetical protein JXR60_02690 [Bacteroidales bacterium]|nr:hypothetical protein [Bacteroidales bacterium]